MSVAKVYNPATSQWEPVVVGKQGPKGDPGIITSATPPDDTSVIWADTTTEEGAIAIPAGGSYTQILAKSSASNYDASWVRPPVGSQYIAPQPANVGFIIRPTGFGAGGSSIRSTNGEFWAFPLVLPRRYKITTVGLRVNIEGSAGSMARLGFYGINSEDDVRLGSLILDAGLVSLETSGAKTISGLSVVSEHELIWCAIAVQGNPTTGPTLYNQSAVYQSIPLGNWNGTLTGNYGVFRTTGITGAFPATISVGNWNTAVEVTGSGPSINFVLGLA